MANAGVLVPGTGGITFRTSLGVDIGYPIGMKLSIALGAKTPEEYQQLLTMEHRPGQFAPVKTTIVPGLSLLPGMALDAGYNLVPASFDRFLYDWRGDLRWNAANLLDYLVHRKPSNGRWNIACHSQGGLIVSLASKLWADAGNSFDELCACVVFGDIPFAGTVNASRALINGDDMGAAAAPVFQQILRTWPALYQQMPRWAAVTDENGNAQGIPQITDTAAWAAYPGVDPDMLQRAIDAQALLAQPFSAITGNTRLAIYFAINRDTATFYWWKDGKLLEDPNSLAPGDTLVPESITTTHLGSSYMPYTRLFKGNIREHAFVFCDPTIMGYMAKEWI